MNLGDDVVVDETTRQLYLAAVPKSSDLTTSQAALAELARTKKRADEDEIDRRYLRVELRSTHRFYCVMGKHSKCLGILGCTCSCHNFGKRT